MPTLIKKRGVKRYRASVMVQGIQRAKLMPDGSRKSYKAAMAWEDQERKRLLTALNGPETPMESVSVERWLDEYLSDVQRRQAEKTYQEKRAAFVRLAAFDGVTAETPVDALLDLARPFLDAQFDERSGYAANKDRKNLSRGWNWGIRYIDGFPRLENPFLLVDRYPEKRQQRYVPSESDFWKVLDAADDGQDRVMLLTFLHTAARRNEILKLKFEDLDFERSRIRLWTRKRRNADLEADWLPMTQDLEKVLKSWVEKRMKQPTIDEKHVFVSLSELPCNDIGYGQPFKYRQHFMERLCSKAGVPYFSFHSIRHLTAAILYRSGYTVQDIQLILRHRSATTTDRYLKSLIGSETLRDSLATALKRPGNVVSLEEKRLKRCSA